jgi:eukaryotic-like serine/threonine-protein kinase
MTAARICPQCEKPVPSDGPLGLCPDCLFKAALSNQSVLAAATGLFDPSSVTAPHPEASGPEAGERVKYFGDYELLEEIARGGMGVVWKARQTSLNRDVAVKMIRAGALASPDEVQRFLREAEAAANLRHPNIVAIHEVGEQDGQHYFSMDYVAGRDLGALVKDGPLSPPRAARYVKIIAEAIHFAHQRGTLHRDLKPQNVLIDAADQPRITDFGLAKLMKDDSRLTQSGVVFPQRWPDGCRLQSSTRVEGFEAVAWVALPSLAPPALPVCSPSPVGVTMGNVKHDHGHGRGGAE